ncbi:MAG TPA: hypothetical protein VFU05_13965 [Cyclobacteriaceae bacterium]|nr:hypothetical protein [Cyclobacteriaceae bacterium]
MYNLRLLAFVLLLVILGCERKSQSSDKGSLLVVDESIFERGVAQGQLDSKELSEASGLAASINNPNFLWTNNDGGDKARIFLIDRQAQLKATVWFNKLKNRDWEAMAVGPGPVDGKNYVYVGDIGDNKAKYEFKFIYRVEEPVIDWSKASDTTLSNINTIKFQYPDGPRDAESMMIDPLTRDIFIISKREEKVNLYRLPFPQSSTETITAELALAKLEFNQHEEKVYSQQGNEKLTNGYHSDFYNQIVSASISRDGNEMLIKSYSSVYYWKRNQGETVAEMIKRMPTRLPYVPEPQGEAITFDVNGEGYFTVNEEFSDNPQKLFFYRRK